MSHLMAALGSALVRRAHAPRYAAAVDAIVRQLHTWRQRQRMRITRRILESLDDRTLRDIGLDRSEIDSIVSSRGASRRHPHVSLF